MPLLVVLAVVAALVIASEVESKPIGITIPDDQNKGAFSINKGFHYSNKSTPVWGMNGEKTMKNVITLSHSCTAYDNSQAGCSSSWQLDWNKLWGKTRCGYAESNHQNSDRFVWRRCSDASCDAYDGTAKIQLAAYSYDDGTKPYPDNPDLLKVFHTLVSAEVPYEYALRMDDSGASTFQLADQTGALLETIVVNHKTRCVDNYYQGSLQGFYFGGQCTAPEQVSVIYSGKGAMVQNI
jgi:hypothetical protein